MITVSFACDGCFEKAEGTRGLQREFQSINDKPPAPPEGGVIP